jgi:hypothetical protein
MELDVSLCCKTYSNGLLLRRTGYINLAAVPTSGINGRFFTGFLTRNLYNLRQ